MIVVDYCHAYGMLSQYSSLVWSVIGCPVVCDEVVCFEERWKQQRERVAIMMMI